MSIFKENKSGGIDVLNEQNEVVLRLDVRDMCEMQNLIHEIQHKNDIINILPDIIGEEFRELNGRFNDSSLVSSVVDKIATDTDVMSVIIEKYETALDNDNKWFYLCKDAIKESLNTGEYVGSVLCEKNHKDLYVDRWRVHILEKGDSYCLNDCLTWDKDEPAVEFYDINANKESFPKGQFTGGRYYMSTLLKLDEQGLSLEEQAATGRELCLYGDVPEWTVSSDALRVIAAWLEAFNKNVEKTTEKLFYSGDVDVPFDVMDSTPSMAVGNDIVESRLKAIPEFTDVSVEYMGLYDKGYGYSVSFSAVNIDEVDVDILLVRVMSDLKFDLCCENGNGSLNNILKYAVERSGDGASNKGTVEKEIE